jgi:hypothetical protein
MAQTFAAAGRIASEMQCTVDVLKELPKHSKREAFLAFCASSASKLLRHDSLRQLILAQLTHPSTPPGDC